MARYKGSRVERHGSEDWHGVLRGPSGSVEWVIDVTPADGPDCVAYLEPEDVADIMRAIVGPEWGGAEW